MRRALRLLLLCSALLPLVGSVHSETSQHVGPAIYFYNPESNINNFASLKTAFDAYVGTLGNVSFQPFSEAVTFEKALAVEKEGIFLLSSWHYRLLRKTFQLRPVLVGTLHGQAAQRKILAVKTDINDVSQLKGLILATASSEAYTRTMLAQILGAEANAVLPQIKCILVPKELDALMAVGFGMADAALASEISLDNLAKLNPKQYEQLARLGVSPPQLLTLAVVAETAAPNTRDLLERLQNGAASADAGNALRMLGLDGLRKLTPAELKELEP